MIGQPMTRKDTERLFPDVREFLTRLRVLPARGHRGQRLAQYEITRVGRSPAKIKSSQECKSYLPFIPEQERVSS